MNLIILIGSMVAAVLAGATVLLLRIVTTGRVSSSARPASPDFSWRHYPIYRLLDATDLDYLRQRGVGRARLRELRAQRRRILRLCMRSMTADFHHVQHAIKLVMVGADRDRADLAAEMAKQRLTFYWNLLKLEAVLIWQACGFDYMPAMDLVAPLCAVNAELQRLVQTSVRLPGLT